MLANVILFLRLAYLLYIFFLGISATWALQLFLNYMQPQPQPQPQKTSKQQHQYQQHRQYRQLQDPTRKRISPSPSPSPLERRRASVRTGSPLPTPPVQHMKPRANDYHMPTAEALAKLSKERSTSPQKSDSKRRERSSSSASTSSRSSRSSRSSSLASGERRPLRWERSKGSRKDTSVSRSPKQSPEDAAAKEHRRLKNLSRYLKT